MHTDNFNEFPESLFFFLLGKPKTHVVCGLIFCETFKRDNIKILLMNMSNKKPNKNIKNKIHPKKLKAYLI